MTAVDAWGLPDARAVAEAVVDVLEERGLVGRASMPSRMLSAAQVAQLLGRSASGSMTTRPSSAPSATEKARSPGSASTSNQ